MPPSVAAGRCPECRTFYQGNEDVCRVCGNSRRQISRKPLRFTSVLRVSVVVVAVAFCGLVGLFYYLRSHLVRSEAYAHALSLALSSPDVQKLLGSDIRVSGSPVGHVLSFDGSEFAEWRVPLSGSHGKGHLYGVANELDGAWNYSRVVFESGKQRVELTPVRRLSLPETPTKTVYIVPLGLTSGESLDWVPSYYQARLGIDVTLLPPVPLDGDLINHTRDQVDGDRVTGEFLQQKFPQFAQDPSVILIAVTSKDMYSPVLGWNYTENLRTEGRFAVVSTARLRPFDFAQKLNPEWLNSRLQKQLTKNIVMLYFDLPMSSDYTSLLSGGVLTGYEIDRMSGSLIGAEGTWDPFFEGGEPSVSIYDVQGKSLLWKRQTTYTAPPDTRSQVFTAELGAGILVQRKADFVFPNDSAMQFTRIYRNQDERSRAFGIGATDSFDMFLVGKMGVAVDLIIGGERRIHFPRGQPRSGQRGDVYRPRKGQGFIEAVCIGDQWTVTATDGSVYRFLYQPNALPEYVTVLSGFRDPHGHEYEIERDSFGVLEKASSPSGAWLEFEKDSEHRIRKITSSTGRTVQYDYDAGGHMVQATSSDGEVDKYTYDDRGQMLTAAHGDEEPIVKNEYSVDGWVTSQTMEAGKRFEYHYSRDGNILRENEIDYPNGLWTYVQYQPGGYSEWLPGKHPQ